MAAGVVLTIRAVSELAALPVNQAAPRSRERNTPA
jgi:hypothetical protein